MRIWSAKMMVEPSTWDDLGKWVWDSSNCEDLAQLRQVKQWFKHVQASEVEIWPTQIT